jgi:hypothetical protein
MGLEEKFIPFDKTKTGTGKNKDPRLNDRKLEERSYLRFEFYESTKDSPHVRYLLFYEDPEIRESRKALISKYQPVSRNSTLMAYTGAESRVFNISFKFTLPHLLNYYNNLLMVQNSPFKTKQELKDEFFDSFRNSNFSTYVAEDGNARQHELYFLDLERDYESDESPVRSGVDDFFNTGYKSTNTTVTRVDSPRPEISKVIDMIMYWTNMVRVSVLNNARNPTNGPPIIRLNHGILYQDIPCVALEYKIDYDKSHGADLRTLLPRVITFEMTLQEIRVGDFGDFDVKKVIQRDNAVGWEAMIGNVNTIDPIRRDIGTRWM